jgi:hypothetical protein
MLGISLGSKRCSFSANVPSLLRPEDPFVLLRKIRPGERADSKYTAAAVYYDAAPDKYSTPGVGQEVLPVPHFLEFEFQEQHGNYWSPSAPENPDRLLKMWPIVSPLFDREVYQNSFVKLITRSLPKGYKLNGHLPTQLGARANAAVVLTREGILPQRAYTILRKAAPGETEDLYEVYRAELILERRDAPGRWELSIIEILQEVLH